MKRGFVQTTLYGKKALRRIAKARRIGTNSKALGSQPPQFEDKPLIFCSYICEGYTGTYGDREGILFEPGSLPIYASPADSFEFLRGGTWLPGHEQFFFLTIENMLKKYPKHTDFRQDFQEYFRNLTPEEIYPRNTPDFARLHYRMDYCLDPKWATKIGCNEITFPKPLTIKNCRIFCSRDELESFLKE